MPQAQAVIQELILRQWSVLFFKAQTKGRRERKRKGKEEEGKERGRERGEREIGTEALAETEKNRKRPSRESNPGPQQTRLMLYH